MRQCARRLSPTSGDYLPTLLRRLAERLSDRRRGQEASGRRASANPRAYSRSKGGAHNPILASGQFREGGIVV